MRRCLQHPDPACKLFHPLPLSRGLQAVLVPSGLAHVGPQGFHWLSPASPGLAPRPPSQPKSIWPEPCPAKPACRRTQASVGIHSLGAELEELWSGETGWLGGQRPMQRQPSSPHSPKPQLHYVSTTFPAASYRASLTFRFLICQRSFVGKAGLRSLWCQLGPLNWGPGRSIFKMKCLQLLGELSEGCGWDLGSSPQCLFTGCLGFLREEWLRSESQCPRNWHSVTSAIFHWSSNKAQIQGGEGSTLHYVS